jgi:chromosome segregation ATPase
LARDRQLLIDESAAVKLERTHIAEERAALIADIKTARDEVATLSGERQRLQLDLSAAVHEHQSAFEDASEQLASQRDEVSALRGDIEQRIAALTQTINKSNLVAAERQRLEAERVRTAAERAAATATLNDVVQKIAAERAAEEKRRTPTIESGEVADWLNDIGLGDYVENFFGAGFTRLQYVALMTAADFARVGVSLPGHRKALTAALNEMRHAYPEARANEQKRLDRTAELERARADAEASLGALRDADGALAAELVETEKRINAAQASDDNDGGVAASLAAAQAEATAARQAAAAERAARLERERAARAEQAAARKAAADDALEAAAARRAAEFEATSARLERERAARAGAAGERAQAGTRARRARAEAAGAGARRGRRRRRRRAGAQARRGRARPRRHDARASREARAVGDGRARRDRAARRRRAQGAGRRRGAAARRRRGRGGAQEGRRRRRGAAAGRRARRRRAGRGREAKRRDRGRACRGGGARSGGQRRGAGGSATHAGGARGV